MTVVKDTRKISSASAATGVASHVRPRRPSRAQDAAAWIAARPAGMRLAFVGLVSLALWGVALRAIATAIG